MKTQDYQIVSGCESLLFIDKQKNSFLERFVMLGFYRAACNADAV